MTDTGKACGAPIRWERTPGGKSSPLDAEPSERGNVVLRGGLAVTMSAGQLEGLTEPRYLSHFATCAQARRKRRAAP